ncbi:uncharacterized protein LOC143915262 [Arctopsyche grandis]|uniref:uncharacterized protein LOC143915262 n=1 Tax=Arctopsyche grandis TaxID=121162 RepID=UPI00406DA3B7
MGKKVKSGEKKKEKDEMTKTKTKTKTQGVAPISKAIAKKNSTNKAQPKPNLKPTQTQKADHGDKKKPNKKQNGVEPKNQNGVAPKSKGKPKADKKPKVAPKVELTDDKPIDKIDKRTKTRLKAEIKKELILRGKSASALTNPSVVEKKLKKLKVKVGTQSKKVQKKIVLFESLLDRLNKEDKTKGGQKQTGPKPKKEKSQNGDVKAKSKSPQNKFVLFIGHLNATVTEEMIREHFKSCGEIQAVRLPIPKKRKHKRFAYVQFDSEETRQKALELHDSMIGECKINVLYSDKSKDKKSLKKNTELRTQRKKTELTTEQMIQVGKKLKANKTKEKKKFSKKV